MTAKEIMDLKQQRASATVAIRGLLDQFENAEMPADKKAELSKMESDFSNLVDRIGREEKQLERERAIGEIADKSPTPSAVKNLFAAALSGDPRHIEAYRNELKLTTDGAAGYLTAPVEFREQLIKGLDNVLFMRQIGKVIGPVGAAQSLGFPYRNAAAADATWIGEIVTAPDETALTFGRREFKPNKMAKSILVSRTLVQHAPMAEGVVLDEMKYRIATGAENAYMNGSGSAQPLGIFIHSASGIDHDRDVSTGNTATTVTFDGLMNAKYSVKQQYQNAASWVLHRDLALMLAKIKDGEGQYIWHGGVVAGQPDRLIGSPVYMSEYAPNTFTTTLYLAVYGDFKNYWICDSDTIGVQVLRELYALTNQVCYLVDYFGDGAPVVNEAFARVKLG